MPWVVSTYFIDICLRIEGVIESHILVGDTNMCDSITLSLTHSLDFDLVRTWQYRRFSASTAQTSTIHHQLQNHIYFRLYTASTRRSSRTTSDLGTVPAVLLKICKGKWVDSNSTAPAEGKKLQKGSQQKRPAINGYISTSKRLGW